MPNGLLHASISNMEPYRKIPWRLSKFQKARQRKRLRAVDTVVSVVDKALSKQGVTTKAVERWKEDMPIEQEMVPKDKYTMFDRKEKKYRKGIHSQCTSMNTTCPNIVILTTL
jgi:Mitochondrial ribosomal protein L31